MRDGGDRRRYYTHGPGNKVAGNQEENDHRETAEEILNNLDREKTAAKQEVDSAQEDRIAGGVYQQAGVGRILVIGYQ